MMNRFTMEGYNPVYNQGPTKTLMGARRMVNDYMEDDGIISYYVSSSYHGDTDPVDLIFQRLEDELGIRSQRVYDQSLSEVDIAWAHDPIIWGGTRIAGYMQYTDADNPIPKAFADPNMQYWQGVMVHEIGHVLGLAEDWETPGSLMSGDRDPNQSWFGEQDILAISQLYYNWLGPVDPNKSNNYNEDISSLMGWSPETPET